MQTIDIIHQLRYAQTIGDVLALPLPHRVHTLKNKDLFDSFADAAAQASGAYFRVNQDGALISKDDEGILAPAFLEAADQVKAAELDAYTISNTKPGPLSIEMSGWCYDSTYGKSVSSEMHADNPDKPKSRVYVCATKEPTWCVPHQNALDIIRQFPLSQILPCQITGTRENIIHLHKVFFTNLIYEKTLFPSEAVRDRQAVFKALEAALEPLGAGDLSLLSGLTFHQRRNSEPRRVFYRAYAGLFTP